MAADDASKSAKETGLTVDEAEGLIEESRDSAIAETQEKTNKQQHKIVLLIQKLLLCDLNLFYLSFGKFILIKNIKSM